MFTVYHSNQLEILKTIVATIINDMPLCDPLQPEVIIVQSTGMAQWMQMELAQQFGIAANIKFPLLASFIWQMFTRIFPDIPEQSAFSKPAMTWKLMIILQQIRAQPEFEVITHYLKNDSDKNKCFQFAARVADLYDQYLVYRPDWLDNWHQGWMVEGLGEAQRWQAPLWRELIHYTEQAGQSLWHRANLYQRFIHTLEKSKTRPSGLPNRIFICGISALPPTYLQALQALGNHIDIHLLFTNPCRYYWGDIRDYAFLTQLMNSTRKHYQHHPERALFRTPEVANSLFNEQGEQQVGNPLLASWGKLGRDNMYLLAQLDCVQEIDAFVDLPNDSLLSLLQRDILELEDYTVLGMNRISLQDNRSKRLLDPTDKSLSLHVCYSPLREVEVLQDNLLQMMMDDPTLSPRDIIVMVSDIERYTPAIRAVFGNTTTGRYLPFTISDRCARHIHPVLTVFFALLELPHSRCTAEQVLSLLEVRVLAIHFSINEEGLKLLRHWVSESGIHWGLDDNTLLELRLPTTGQHTWHFGINRMLLGYAMDSHSGDWQGILPYDESSGLIAELVGHLADLLMSLRYWRDYFAIPRKLKDWLPCVRRIIKDFFTPDAEAEATLVMLEHQWQQVILPGIEAGYDESVPVTLLRDELTTRLNQERVSQSFLAGTLNFCSLMPMRSIPFKVVCLLGMNDGAYPRSLPPISFDLMAQHTRRGDRSRRDDDCYLFLEVLLSAQKKLYISFIGRDIHDNVQHHPSILVSELIDYIAQSVYLPEDKLSDAETSAARVIAHLWQWHSRMPFAPENFIPGNIHQSFSAEWLPAANNIGTEHPFFVQALPTLPIVSILFEELKRFYSHPVKFWFQQRLSVYFSQEALDLASDEPFIIDNLTSYQLKKKIINTMIYEECNDTLYRQVRASGLLPYGAFGEIYWSKQCQEMSILAKTVRKHRQLETDSMEIILLLDNIKLSGWLNQVQKNGLLRWRPGNLSMKDGLMLWLEHLAYCAMGGCGDSHMFGILNEWHFAPIAPKVAKEYLISLVSGYCDGMTTPLLLLNRSGGAWLNTCIDRHAQNIKWDETSQHQARDRLIQTWKGDDYMPGECTDLYLYRLIRQLDAVSIKAIIQATEKYLLPPFLLNLAEIKLIL